MRTYLLASLGLLLAGAGWASAQTVPAAQPSAASPTASPQTGSLPWADPEADSQDKKSWLNRLVSGPEQPPPTRSTTLPAPVAADPPAKEDAPGIAETTTLPRKDDTTPTGPAAPLADTVFNTPACPDGCCAPKCNLETPPPPGCWWISADYLLWWIKHSTVPGPLLVVGGPPSSNGIAGAPGTTSFGQAPNFLNFGAFNGVQMTAGVQVPDAPFGLELGGFILEQRTNGVGFNSNAAGNPIISLPFISTNPLMPDRVIAAFPGAFAGGATILNNARMYGAEANFAKCCLCCKNLRGDWLCGVRYLNLSETIGMQLASIDIPPAAIGFFQGVPLPPRTVVTSTDRFATLNNFYGPQIGGRLEWHYGSFYTLTTGKIALGVSDEILSIGGASSAFPAGAPAPLVAPGGVFTQVSNIGHTNKPQFAAVPEFGMTFGFQVTRRLRVYAGYNAIYWSNVVRPGDQISSFINRAQIPLSAAFAPVVQPTQPFPFFRTSDFWVQGVNIGMAFHF